MKKYTAIIAPLFACAAAFADSNGTINGSSDPLNPALWSDTANWVGGTPASGTTSGTGIAYLASSSSGASYFLVDENVSINCVYANVGALGEYHLSVADGKTLTTSGANNRLFISDTAQPAANTKFYFDSGVITETGSIAMYLPKNGNEIIIGADATVNFNNFKVRSLAGANHTKRVTLNGTFTSDGPVEIYGNTKSGSSTAFVIGSTGSVTTGSASTSTFKVNGVGVSIDTTNTDNNTNVGSAVEIYGNLTVNATGTSNFRGYALGNSAPTVVVRDGGVATFAKSNLSVYAAAHENAGTVLNVESGGTLSTKIFNVFGNGTNYTAQRTAISSGTFTATGLYIKDYGDFEITGGTFTSGYAELNMNTKLSVSGGVADFGDYIYIAQVGELAVSTSGDWSGTQLLYRGGQTTLDLSGNSTLEVAGIFLHEKVSGKKTDITIESGSKLIVGSTSGTAAYLPEDMASLVALTNTNYINLIDFEEGSVAFKEIGDAADQAAALSHIKLDGAYSEDLRFSDFDSSIGGYWLTTAPIPEPATWAAIFGAVALGFAAYRRRK